MPYGDSLAHLAEELARLLLLLHAAIDEFRRSFVPSRDASPAAILDEEIDWHLSRPLRLGTPSRSPAAEAALREADRLAAAIAGRVADAGDAPRLVALARRFGLGRRERDALLLALAPELDPRFERLFGYLHDDLTQRRASAELALRVLARDDADHAALRRALGPGGVLVREGLLRREDGPTTLLAAPLVVDARVVDFLHGGDAIDPRLSDVCRRVAPAADDPPIVAPPAVARALDELGEAWLSGQDLRGIYLHGPAGVGRAAAVLRLCARLGAAALRVDLAALQREGPERFARALELIRREALLGGLVVVWDELDALPEERRVAVLRASYPDEGPAVRAALLGAAAWEPGASATRGELLAVRWDRPTLPERRALWTAALARRGATLAPEELSALVAAYNLAGGAIADVVAAAVRQAGPALTRGAIDAALRRRASHVLGPLARPLPPRLRWDDLVLAPDRKDMLHELVRHAVHREKVLDAWGFRGGLAGGRGLIALFSGASGTGKTLAAGLVAGKLGVEAYQIDLSAVVSKYIGETEKHLARLFDEAEAASALLFFDEADALFGKRTEVRDAHDRYANIETSYLLQRLDSYDGVVILASNFRRNMDEAFLRRMHFCVDFPLPEAAERLQIWRRVLPPELPREPDLDLAKFAERFQIAGGNIRNIAVAAAFLAAADDAPLGARHLVAATRREFQKLGKVVDAGQFAGL